MRLFGVILHYCDCVYPLKKMEGEEITNLPFRCTKMKSVKPSLPPKRWSISMVCVFSVQNRICKCKGEDISKHCVQSFCCLAPSVESLWQEKRANFLVERGPTPIFASFCTLIQCIYGATTKVQTFLPKKEKKKYDCISSKVVSIHFQ